MRNSCPAVPTWGGGILYTEFIQICTMFVVDFDRQHHIHLNSLVFQTKFVSTGKCEKYRFHGESSQNWRVSACMSCIPRRISAIKRLRSSHRIAQRTLGARGAPRCIGIRMLPLNLKKTGSRQAVRPHCKILKMQKSALAF